MRSFSALIDSLAASDPDGVWVKMPVFAEDKPQSTAWVDVTWSQLSRAVDEMAYWIEDKLGLGDKQTITYIGTNDIRYGIVIFAAEKTGYRVSCCSSSSSSCSPP